MNKFKFYFTLLITSFLIFSCTKHDDNTTAEPIIDYAVQYKTDSITIDTYLKNYYITVKDAPGQTTDQDVTMTKITDPTTQPSIYSYLNAATFPKLKSKIVALDNINYTLYYLVLREGTGESPCNVDGVFTSYNGTYLYNTTATTTTPSQVVALGFEQVVYPSAYLSLFTTILGWGETFPEFKSGGHNFDSSNGAISYTDFGSGVMFLPSALAYYNNATATIPAYSPLVFSFKLYDIQRLDQDGDGIPSYLEDLNGDGYIRTYSTTSTVKDEIKYADDTDHDGIPDFFDIDDDADTYITRLEITKNTTTGELYPFADIPINPVTGKKIYLDGTFHP